MSKSYFLVDGFNLYHALDADARYRRYKWLSLTRLCQCFVTKADSITGIEYFTTLATWDVRKVARHKLFIRAQENEGVRVAYGSFKRKHRKCMMCGQMFQTFEEKQTDVNIALRLFQLSVEDKYDRAVIVSEDTDLLPAIRAVHATFPANQIGVIVPIGRASEDLKKHADFHYKMKEKHLQSSRYENVISLRDGTTLTCPTNWQ